MKVFISHAVKDQLLANYWKELISSLTSGLIEVWYSSDMARGGGIPGGTDWRQSIISHLHESAAIIAIITPESRTSTWITWECGAAAGFDQERLIFPVYYNIGIPDVPGPLIGYQAFNGLDKEEVRKVCQDILMVAKDKAEIQNRVFNRLFQKYQEGISNAFIRSTRKYDLPESVTLSFDIHRRWVLDVDWIGGEDKEFVSVSDDATIKIAPLDLKLKPISITESNSIKCASYVPETNGLIYGLVDGQVKYRVLSNQLPESHFLYEHPHIRVLAFANTIGMIASGGYNNELLVHSISLDDVRVTNKLARICSGNVRAVEWSTDGTALAYSEGPLINIVETDALYRDGNRLVFSGHAGSVVCISWNSDGSYLASGDEQGVVIIWSALSGKVKHYLNRSSTLGIIRSVAFEPGKQDILAVGGAGMVEVINLRDEGCDIEAYNISTVSNFTNRIRWDSTGTALLLACGDTVKFLSFHEVSR